METPPHFSPRLASHATYDANTNTVVFERSMSPENRDELRRHFPKDKARIDQGYIESNRYHPERLAPIEMGYELRVPRLCVRESPELLLPFDEETVYEQMDFDAASNWDEAELVRWLDDRLAHNDIPASDMTIALSRVIADMTTAKGMKLRQLVVDKFLLLKSVQRALVRFRDELRVEAYQELLLPQSGTPLAVTPECCFAYGEHYPVNTRYQGNIKFNRHLYADVGELNAEEEQCAQKLDNHPQVEAWVRNLEKREENSFWLQTSTDKFYPDFVCKLKDGRILVVEYKGHHLYSNADSAEKRTIGELWAKLSGGKCLFIMTDGMNLDRKLLEQGL